MNGRPLLSLSWISQALGYQVQGKGSGTVNIKSNNGGYGFTLAAGDKEVPRYWFGVPVRPVQLFTEPVQSGGEWYVDETDLKNVFGYFSVWNDEQRTHLTGLLYPEQSVRKSAKVFPF